MRAIVVLVVILLSWQAGAVAETLYSADGAAGNPTTNLYILDPATGAVLSTVGPIGFAVTGLAFDVVTQVLYGATSFQSPVSPKSLVRIDTSTGAGTLIGPFGDCVMPDIGFSPTGVLYGWSDSCSDGDDLFTIDVATGMGTHVANSGVGTFGSGLAANAAGVMYLAGTGSTGALHMVDTMTGQLTQVATLSGAPGALSAAVAALDFNAADVLFGIVLNQGTDRAAFLVTVDTASGVVTNRGQTVSNTDAIAFVTSARPAPAMSRATAAALAVLLFAAGLSARRFRNSAPH